MNFRNILLNKITLMLMDYFQVQLQSQNVSVWIILLDKSELSAVYIQFKVIYLSLRGTQVQYVHQRRTKNNC